MNKILTNTFLFLCLMLLPQSSFGQTMGGDRMPYGHYCPGPQWGWYGAKSAVRTADGARKILLEYFKGEKVSIGNVREKGWFFEADIRDKNGILIDIVIVDKRTARIRSIY
ncbi:MAG: hypothetical protein HY787_11405 [Deltaproteobacteria bacterium]|nr:hypothetical protein [Deltaproteobacteria bacterium]